MYYDEKDIILLNWLASENGPLEISKENAPHDVQVNILFHGLIKDRTPDSIWVRLRDLKTYGLVKQVDNKRWEITEAGKIELRKINKEIEETNYITSLEFGKLRKEVLDLDNRITDFKSSKIRSIWAIIISVLSLLASIVLGILQMKK